MTDIFEKFNSLNILIIGDVMMDSYVWGKIDRISPEAPVPVVRITKRENRLGGAANVALNVQALGAMPLICAVVGDDSNGKELLSLFEQSDLSSDGLLVLKDRPTTVKTRIIANNQQIVRVDAEDESDISDESTRLMQDKITEILNASKIDAIIFEDYDKGLLSEGLITSVVNLANEMGILTVVDPKKKNFLFYKDVSLFKPNLKELTEGLKIHIDPSDHMKIKAAVEELKIRIGAENVMLTLSEHGVFISTSKESQLIPAHVRKIADVSGAGDTVIAAAAICLAAGLGPLLTAAISNLAGGLVCEHAGVVPIDKGRLLEEVSYLNKN